VALAAPIPQIPYMASSLEHAIVHTQTPPSQL
jgi:hypothetical protein